MLCWGQHAHAGRGLGALRRAACILSTLARRACRDAGVPCTTLHLLTAWLLQVHNIVVGKNGTVIGEIGKRARTELELIFGVRVHLYLQVKHRDS